MSLDGGTPKRFWAKHKVQAVLRLLRGEDIDLVSRELGVTAATLTLWRDTFLEAGEAGLLSVNYSWALTTTIFVHPPRPQPCDHRV